MNPVTDTQRQAWRDAIAAQLKAERALRGLEQESVCEGAGISRSTYSRMERGAGAKIDHLLAVVEVFGIPLSEFIARAEAEMVRRQPDPAVAQATPTKGVRATVHKSGSPVNHDQATNVTKSPKR